MRTRRIHLINPKSETFTTRPMFFNRALYSPLAGLLTVAAHIPRNQYEVILTDENIEPVDFSLKSDLVGITAMTSYVKRGYEIADRFRQRGIPVIMGGVHPSFMPEEALGHADAVVVGEAELVMKKVLEDLGENQLKGIYKGGGLCSLEKAPIPRYDLIKTNRYLNRTFVQTSRGCHHACLFCAEHLMFGLKFRYRPIDEVIREIEGCQSRVIALNDADFFGNPGRAAKLMRALKGRGIRWQAGVNSRDAFNDELLELAAESNCYMLSIGFESISRETLKDVFKHQNRPENYEALVKKIHSYGIMVFGLFMFGFDRDDPMVFDETVDLNIKAAFDVCAYSVLTPYPGTLIWFEFLRDGRMVNFDWNKYDQCHIVYRPSGLSPHQIQEGYLSSYQRFYSLPSILKRFPVASSRSRLHWSAYNFFFQRGVHMGSDETDIMAAPTETPQNLGYPPIMPKRKEWQQLLTQSNHQSPVAIEVGSIPDTLHA
jgi:radical SAM superfamily enzyme YgiQ (UPF0313 family)